MSETAEILVMIMMYIQGLLYEEDEE